jgi:hypothetical protein
LLIVQPVGGVTAFQLKFVPELVVPEAARPVGALGEVAHVPPPLPPVPLRAEVCVPLSVTVRVPLAAPEAVGAKYT